MQPAVCVCAAVISCYLAVKDVLHCGLLSVCGACISVHYNVVYLSSIINIIWVTLVVQWCRSIGNIFSLFLYLKERLKETNLFADSGN